MKPHTIAVIFAFGAAMWLAGYYTPISQGWGFGPLGLSIFLGFIFGVVGIVTYHD